MRIVKGQQAVVTGGSRGLGLGIVEALVEQQAIVTVVARDRELLDNISKRLNVNVIQGDVTEESVARKRFAQPSAVDTCAQCRCHSTHEPTSRTMLGRLQ